ncbi:hypothetical protein ACPDIX_11230 [Limisphaera sp. 4302-co]
MMHNKHHHNLHPRNTIILASAILIAASLPAAMQANAEAQLTLLHSFSEETKIKGPFAHWGGQLYGVADKGGSANAGYIGRLDPSTGSWVPVYEFSTETKVKGGLVPIENRLWFVCEKGGSAGYGYIGAFDPAAHTVTVLADFTSETKPKTPPMSLDGQGWYFLTDKGGAAGLGALMKFDPDTGLTVVASFDQETGFKFEAPPVAFQGRIWYAAREGGDLSQMSGKGAGAIGTIDLQQGRIERQLVLNAANHGAKIRALLPVGDKLYYAAEEGGDLTLNSGKGYGGIGCYDPQTGTGRWILVCDGPINGAKPKATVRHRDHLYYLCAEGGPTGYGLIGRIANDTSEIVATFDASTGAKAEALTLWENRLFLVTELGAANWFGGIAALQLPIPRQPVLLWERQDGILQLRWTPSAAWTLESAPTPSGPWSPVETSGTESGTLSVNPVEPARFFRLRPVTP